jgi:hypothetical protein
VYGVRSPNQTTAMHSLRVRRSTGDMHAGAVPLQRSARARALVTTTVSDTPESPKRLSIEKMSPFGAHSTAT